MLRPCCKVSRFCCQCPRRQVGGLPGRSQTIQTTRTSGFDDRQRLGLKVPVEGLYSSALVRSESLLSLDPPTIRTRPLLSRSPCGPTRISAELYDPSTGTFTPAGNLAGPSGGATLLASGKVLITGLDCPGSPVDEIYDPSKPTACYESRAILLMNGKVLVSYGDGGSQPAIAELYDPAFGIF